MTWPPRQPPRTEHPDEDQGAYDTVVERARGHRQMADPEKDAGYFGRLLLSPKLAAHHSDMGRIFRGLGNRDDSFSHADREFVDQVLSVDLNTNVVQAMHLNDALSAGVRLEAIEALRAGNMAALTDDERQLVAFIRKVLAGAMDEPTWLAMEARMGERATLEYALFTLHLQATMRLMSAVGFASPSNEQVDSWIAAFRSGEREIDDFRKRVSW